MDPGPPSLPRSAVVVLHSDQEELWRAGAVAAGVV